MFRLETTDSNCADLEECRDKDTSVGQEIASLHMFDLLFLQIEGTKFCHFLRRQSSSLRVSSVICPITSGRHGVHDFTAR